MSYFGTLKICNFEILEAKNKQTKKKKKQEEKKKGGDKKGDRCRVGGAHVKKWIRFKKTENEE